MKGLVIYPTAMCASCNIDLAYPMVIYPTVVWHQSSVPNGWVCKIFMTASVPNGCVCKIFMNARVPNDYVHKIYITASIPNGCAPKIYFTASVPNGCVHTLLAYTTILYAIKALSTIFPTAVHPRFISLLVYPMGVYTNDIMLWFMSLLADPTVVYRIGIPNYPVPKGVNSSYVPKGCAPKINMIAVVPSSCVHKIYITVSVPSGCVH